MKSQEIVIVNALEYELREAADFLVKHSDECDPAYFASVAETMLHAAQALATLGEARGGTWQPTYPRVINNDGTLRLEQTAGPNSYLVVRRNSDNAEVASVPCVTTEPRDEIVRLLLGAWVRAVRDGQTPEAK